MIDCREQRPSFRRFFVVAVFLPFCRSLVTLVLSVVCAGVVALVLILSSLAILTLLAGAVTRVSLSIVLNVTLNVADADPLLSQAGLMCVEPRTRR